MQEFGVDIHRPALTEDISKNKFAVKKAPEKSKIKLNEEDRKETEINNTKTQSWLIAFLV